MSLVVGVVSTIDSDQSAEVDFKYKIAGKDAKLFLLDDATRKLYLKAQPDFEKKPYYEIFIISTDNGGKKYAKNFKINVLKETVVSTMVSTNPNEISDTKSLQINSSIDSSGPVVRDFIVKTTTISLVKR